MRADGSHSVLNDVKIFVREDPHETEQTYFSTTPGAGWVHHTYRNMAANSDHFFDVVSVYACAQMALLYMKMYVNLVFFHDKLFSTCMYDACCACS